MAKRLNLRLLSETQPVVSRNPTSEHAPNRRYNALNSLPARCFRRHRRYGGALVVHRR